MGANDKVAATWHGTDLSEIIRKAKAEAWEEGHEVGAAEYWDSNTPANPYRSEGEK